MNLLVACYTIAWLMLTSMIFYIKYPRIIKAGKYLYRVSVAAPKVAAEAAMLLGVFLIPIIVSVICYLAG